MQRFTEELLRGENMRWRCCEMNDHLWRSRNETSKSSKAFCASATGINLNSRCHFPANPRLPATLQLKIVHIVATRDKSSAAKSDVDPAALKSRDTSRRRRRAGLFNRGRQPELRATLSDNFFQGRAQSRSAPATPLFISNETSASMRQAL